MRITSLGDSTPSEIMDKLLDILGPDNQPDLLFRYHFLQILPDYVRAPLSLCNMRDVSQLAAHADRIFHAGRPRAAALALEATMSDPAEEVDHVKPQRHGRDRKRQDDWLCFYHRCYGKDARRCVSPCRMQNAKNGQSGQRQ
jgi:hypothetical protein